MQRLPPHSVEAEGGFLSCILQNPNPLAGTAAAQLPWVEALYDLRHQTIYSAILRMHEARIPIDLITLSQSLKDGNLLEQVGGLAYLSQILDASPSSANFEHYTQIVRDKFALRKSIQFCTNYIGRVYEYEGDINTALNDFEQGVLGIRRDFIENTNNGFISIPEIQQELDDHYSAAMLTKERPGIQTGYVDLDNLIGGLIAPDVFILAARPSVGKTSLAMNIVENISVRNNCITGVFSLEMSAKQLLHRMACSIGRANGQKIMRGTLEDEDMRRMAAGHAKIALAKERLVIVDKGGLNVFQLASYARQMVSRKKVQVIVIDYLGLINPGRKLQTRNDEVSYISQSIKTLAKELNVPILLISQLNRASDKDGRPPRMSDLRDSGSLEQDGDIIGLLYPEESGDGKFAKMKLNIAKHRNGEVGLVRLLWRSEFVRFESEAKIEEKDVPKSRTPYPDE